MYYVEELRDGILMYKTTPDSEWRPVMGNKALAFAALQELCGHERKELFGYFCHGCGVMDTTCQCWNDE